MQDRITVYNPWLGGQIFVFDSLFYESLSRKSSALRYDRVKNFSKQVDIFSRRFVVVPIHQKQTPSSSIAVSILTLVDARNRFTGMPSLWSICQARTI